MYTKSYTIYVCKILYYIYPSGWGHHQMNIPVVPAAIVRGHRCQLFRMILN